MRKKDSLLKQIVVDFKKCTKEDFKKQGYHKEIDIGVDNLLCPDTEKLSNKY